MDDVDAELAMFDPSGGGAFTIQYDAEHAGVRYFVRYKYGWLTISDQHCTETWFEQHTCRREGLRVERRGANV